MKLRKIAKLSALCLGLIFSNNPLAGLISDLEEKLHAGNIDDVMLIFDDHVRVNKLIYAQDGLREVIVNTLVSGGFRVICEEWHEPAWVGIVDDGKHTNIIAMDRSLKTGKVTAVLTARLSGFDMYHASQGENRTALWDINHESTTSITLFPGSFAR